MSLDSTCFYNYIDVILLVTRSWECPRRERGANQGAAETKIWIEDKIPAAKDRTKGCCDSKTSATRAEVDDRWGEAEGDADGAKLLVKEEVEGEAD